MGNVGDANPSDPSALHAFGTELMSLEDQGFALMGYVAEFVEQQSTDAVPVFRRPVDDE